MRKAARRVLRVFAQLRERCGRAAAVARVLRVARVEPRRPQRRRPRLEQCGARLGLSAARQLLRVLPAGQLQPVVRAALRGAVSAFSERSRSRSGKWRRARVSGARVRRVAGAPDETAARVPEPAVGLLLRRGGQPQPAALPLLVSAALPRAAARASPEGVSPALAADGRRAALVPHAAHVPHRNLLERHRESLFYFSR